MNHHRISRLWQSATLFLAPPLLVLLIWLRPSMGMYQWLLWLHLPLLMLHEAESTSLRRRASGVLQPQLADGVQERPGLPARRGIRLPVNILIAWPMVILGALLASVAPWVGFAMIWFELILNNAMHGRFPGRSPATTPAWSPTPSSCCPTGWVLLTATGFFTPLDWVLSALLGVGIAAVLGLKTRGRLAQVRPFRHDRYADRDGADSGRRAGDQPTCRAALPDGERYLNRQLAGSGSPAAPLAAARAESRGSDS